MRTRSAAVPLLLIACAPFAAQAISKPHTVSLGAVKRVPYLPPEATPENRDEETTTLKIRPLLVDGHIKEWTVGEIHEITDRTFVVRRVLHLNDALPTEAAHWSWQPGPWLSVDRTTGRVTALHLPDFDPQVSEVSWFRDYAAYCGVHLLAKSTTLTAIVVQIGARRPAVSQKISPWPTAPPHRPACEAATWQRAPHARHPAPHRARSPHLQHHRHYLPGRRRGKRRGTITPLSVFGTPKNIRADEYSSPDSTKVLPTRHLFSRMFHR